MRPRHLLRTATIALATIAMTVACSSDDGDEGAEDTTVDDDPANADGEPDDAAIEDDADDVDVGYGSEEETIDDGVVIDLDATRDDVDCSDEGLGADDVFSFDAGHYVVDGILGELCTGDDDDRLFDAWDALATIAPRGQLGDLGVFTAFVEEGAGDEVTLAFVQPLDADGTLFQMSVNLDEFEFDPQEALLTMAHEFSHVFTAIPSQTDRTIEAIDNCRTYSNGESCFFADSLVNQWVDTFWVDYIDDFEPIVEATGADGEERCAIDAGFLGSYAASTPEEDFAESFSAYVFDVPAATPEQQERIDWMADQPGLVEFRERAEDAGLTPVRNGFDVCGPDA